MPRDISGTYTLPLAPIEPRTIPVVNWVNPTVEDIAAALNNIPLTALSGVPGSPGLLALTYTGLASRTITGTAGQIDVANGDGLSGNPVLSIPASPTLDGAVNLSGGQLRFPATQNPSSDPNTLDDYEEGTWTPSLTFVTPGDLNVVYSQRTGYYTKIGNLVYVSAYMIATTFTHSTASGEFLIGGLPFIGGPTYGPAVVSDTKGFSPPAGSWMGAYIRGNGSFVLSWMTGVNFSTLNQTHVPSGSLKELMVSAVYLA